MSTREGAGQCTSLCWETERGHWTLTVECLEPNGDMSAENADPSHVIAALRAAGPEPRMRVLGALSPPLYVRIAQLECALDAARVAIGNAMAASAPRGMPSLLANRYRVALESVSTIIALAMRNGASIPNTPTRSIEELIAASSLGQPFAEPSEAELDIAIEELRKIEGSEARSKLEQEEESGQTLNRITHEVSERVLRMLYLYAGHRVDSRGVIGLIHDVLKLTLPEAQERLASGEHPDAVYRHYWPTDDAISYEHAHTEPLDLGKLRDGIADAIRKHASDEELSWNEAMLAMADCIAGLK